MEQAQRYSQSKELQRLLKETGRAKIVIDPWDNDKQNRARAQLSKAGQQIGAKVSCRRNGNAIVGTIVQAEGQEIGVPGDDVGLVMGELRKTLASLEDLLNLRRPTKEDVLIGLARHRDSLRAAELMAKGLED
jgi:hypothetical protein